MNVLLKGKNTLLCTKIWEFCLSKIFQGVRIWDNINSQTVWKIFIVEFQGVGSVKCKIFLLKLQELTPFYDLESKFEFFQHFFGKIKSFPIFNIFSIPKLGFSRKKTKILVNVLLKGKNTVLCTKIWEFCLSKIFQGVRIWDNINSQTVWKIFIVEFQGVGSVKCKIFVLKLQELTPFYDLEAKFEFF